jgi:hypothetical protein
MLGGLHEPRATHRDMPAALCVPGPLRDARALALDEGCLGHELG